VNPHRRGKRCVHGNVLSPTRSARRKTPESRFYSTSARRYPRSPRESSFIARFAPFSRLTLRALCLSGHIRAGYFQIKIPFPAFSLVGRSGLRVSEIYYSKYESVIHASTASAIRVPRVSRGTLANKRAYMRLHHAGDIKTISKLDVKSKQ